MVLCWIYNIIWNIAKGKKLGRGGGGGGGGTPLFGLLKYRLQNVLLYRVWFSVSSS